MRLGFRKIESRISDWLKRRREDRMIAEYGGINLCPWCGQCAQNGPSWSFEDYKEDPFLDVLTCGVCRGTSLWRWEMIMLFVAPLDPPTPKFGAEILYLPRKRMRLVIIESPYAGEIEANVAYARSAMWDCLQRDEAPWASHLLYTQVGVLDDSDPVQRARGIEAGLQWGRHAEATVVYTDRGISAGMKQGIERATSEGRPVEYRTIAGR